ncbi:glutathione S-transferase [Rhodobium orientis]|uniref:Glutathione S-transferase n=1 Tax=Rhodobium orientis TaxID=34017 RepID=A0A327JGL7_9HYPH|nr:glutathione S-transferase family protein [Rhodobium orientis]MBB4301544.1 glutathione S-transferase [Rhodobium orientis]MBK5952241.1 glutathione S-transferase [Rhodobium orientis]RAI24826.1 glutathione S-transferase [Rhodobium orientis]
MAATVILYGYRFSVYHRIARMALHEKGVPYDVVDVDPFADDVPDAYRAIHPFGRVPALRHGAFTLYETAAITRYVDAAFDGPALTPTDPKALARMAQIIAIIDSYGYWPLVRQVFAHRVFRPAEGAVGDEAEIAAGLEAAGPVLAALEAIAAEGLVLNGRDVTLADCHLAPMTAYFTMAGEGAAAMKSYPALMRWWAWARALPSLVETDPGLPDLPA